MESKPDTEVIDGVTFDLEPQKKNPIRKQRVGLRKNRESVRRYLQLADEFRHSRMVEIGVDRGGSTAFYCKLLQPAKMASFEISDKPLPTLARFLTEHDPDGAIQVHWGVDQADRAVVPRILNETFAEEPLDLVVDDASHRLGPSTDSFEMIFPRLREGGLYILEDWSGFHHHERSLQHAISKDPEGPAAQAFFGAVNAGKQPKPPMSILICQLVIACGFKPDWISDIHLFDGFCEVRRGPGEIAPETPLADYTGTLGQWIFEPRLA